jgi:hypothetical protein
VIQSLIGPFRGFLKARALSNSLLTKLEIEIRED